MWRPPRRPIPRKGGQRVGILPPHRSGASVSPSVKWVTRAPASRVDVTEAHVGRRPGHGPCHDYTLLTVVRLTSQGCEVRVLPASEK